MCALFLRELCVDLKPTLNPYITAYGIREVDFKFRGRTYNFTLSHGLFSSADIDTGSKFLLKIFSQQLEKVETLPRTILDAGSGVGVLGICTAGAILDSNPALSLHVHSQDRDELARIFTEYNARQNNLLPEILDARTEPLLTSKTEDRYDLILSNIPAKAGLPVLEDFVPRSISLLNPQGRVIIVVVNTLAIFFKTLIEKNAVLLQQDKGPEHTVFIYTQDEQKPLPAFHVLSNEDFHIHCPGYIRNKSNYEMENIPYHLDTIHGAAGFDNADGAVQIAAKLTVKLKEKIAPDASPILVWQEDQGHYATWFAKCFGTNTKFIFAGRNVLALSMARHNCLSVLGKDVHTISAADILLDHERILSMNSTVNSSPGFPFIAYFPEIVPGTVIETAWEGLSHLALPSCIAITAFTSSEAERFDRKKPQGWHRLGDIKRKGFRAMGYQKE